MKEDRPRNAYCRADFDVLYDACQRRAAELMTRDSRPRTAAERSALALDTAHLLLSVAATLHNDDVYSVISGWREARKDVLTAFLPKHESALRSARYRTLVGATEAVFGGSRPFWLRDAWVDDERAYDLALSSELGLQKVLLHLQDLSKKR
jgi:hypothetical protein